MTPPSATPAPSGARFPGRRKIRWLLAAVLLAAVAGAIGYAARPAIVTRVLVEQIRSRLGLDLVLERSVGYGLVPTLELRLATPDLRPAGGNAPLFTAERLELALPWRSLWQRPPAIERLVVDRPQVDLDVLESWLATRPAQTATGGTPAFRLQVRDGSLKRGETLLATGIDLDLEHAGELDAWLAQWRREGSRIEAIPPLSGKAGVRAIEIDGTRIEGLRLEVQPDPDTSGPKSGH